MTDLSIIAAALFAAAGGSELALRGTKLQTGLARVLMVWGGIYAATVFALLHSAVGPIAFTILWSGAFLSWFGIRSHIESSILLRMLVLLRQGPMTEALLVSEYLSIGGEAVRVEELCRGGLAQNTHGHISVTPKGKTILRVVSTLR